MQFLTKFALCQLGKAFKSCPLQYSRAASTYEGDGKTTAQVLNKDLEYFMVSAFSSIGFRLNTGIRLVGPVIIFPRTFLCWNVSGIEDVHSQSLSIFNVLCPKLDILVLGYGDTNTLPRDVKLKILDFSKKNNIGIEMLPTEKAVSTFNYLNYEKRYVAGAFIPPKKVQFYNDEDYAKTTARQQIISDE